ncbi:zinc metallochaperone AztD [Cryobacterium sp. N22]|uniref:zinc metallochaperone AztD n=1 Tax=Cryobacterium sp. N22 TaxID=2048290 RepID=UPI000CE3BB1B|nr:zinc metallochaperone AztD [Cryobacterium sp. N22]
MKTHHRTTAFFGVIAASTLLLSACAGTDAAPGGSGAGSAGTAAADAQPRVTLTYDGGLYVLNGDTLDLEADLPLAGFNRLNTAGDGRHVLVTTTEGFRVLDTGTWTDAAGDAQTADPRLTDLVFEAPAAGHVVKHGDKTILYADGTGETTIFDTAALLEADELPATEVIPAEAAHHGVSIELDDGTLLTTVGTSEARTGIRVLNADREEIARNAECPSVHGEGAAADEIAVFGCSDGVLVYDNGMITKIAAPDAYGRTGNAYVSETSSIAVGDYNSDPDSEGYLLSELVLVDTVAKTSTVIDLPAGVEYTWRGVARGPNDEALILASDGSLYVLDPETGELGDSYPVIGAWESPVEWQDAHPALTVVGGTAYVTEPATNSLHAVDLATGEVITSVELHATPNEIAVVTG